MNAVRREPGGAAPWVGLLLLGLGLSLLFTNLVGMWLALHVALLGSLVLGSWPMMLIGAGLFLLGHAAASRWAVPVCKEEPHGHSRAA